MSLSFTSALSQEPIVTRILENLGEDYLLDLDLDSISNSLHYPKSGDSTKQLSKLSSVIQHIFETLPIPVWYGSNNWVLSSDRSKSGKVLLANDTHIKYSQPAVWYEAYLEYPGFLWQVIILLGYLLLLLVIITKLRGELLYFHLIIWIYIVKNKTLDNPNQVWVNDHWQEYSTVTKVIPVKGAEDIDFTIRSTRHGPVLNGIYNNFPAVVGTLAVGSLLVWSYFSFNDDANSKALTSTQNKSCSSC